MKRLIILSLAVIAGLFGPFMVSAPANAITCVAGICQGGLITHYHNDTGYDKAIVVFCNFGSDNREYVAEGTSSKQDCGDDTDEVLVRSGEELWCITGINYNTGGNKWGLTFVAGRHKIGDLWEETCTLRLA